MAKALVAARAGFRRLFSISAFTPPPATVPPPAEPSPNLFVSGLSKRTTSEGLREAFSKFGNLIHARVVTDRVSGYSKGFGFVRYATIEEAAEGIKGMDGKFLDGWVIFAAYAKPRPQPSQGQLSQSPQNTSSAPPSNYTSQASQSWSSYRSPQASEPLPSYSSFSSQESQLSSNYSHHSPQTLQTSQSSGLVPPSNYSFEPSLPPPSNFASVQATNYSQASKSQQGYSWAPASWNNSQASQPPNYAPLSHAATSTFSHQSCQTSQPTYSSMHETSEPVSSYASAPPRNYPSNSEMHSANQTSEPLFNYEFERSTHY